jgi:hypothetical protein
MNHTLNYPCPVCDTKFSRIIDYPDPSLFANPSSASMVFSSWCSRCNAKNELVFSIVEENKDSYFAHVHSFTTNGIPQHISVNLERK